MKGMTLRKLNPHGHTESIEQAMPADVWITIPIKVDDTEELRMMMQCVQRGKRERFEPIELHAPQAPPQPRPGLAPKWCSHMEQVPPERVGLEPKWLRSIYIYIYISATVP